MRLTWETFSLQKSSTQAYSLFFHQTICSKPTRLIFREESLHTFQEDSAGRTSVEPTNEGCAVFEYADASRAAVTHRVKSASSFEMIKLLAKLVIFLPLLALFCASLVIASTTKLKSKVWEPSVFSHNELDNMIIAVHGFKAVLLFYADWEIRLILLLAPTLEIIIPRSL